MGFVRDFVHHPRKLRLRRACFQVHLWAGVLCCVYLVLIAVSGSLLVYKDEMTRWQMPKGLRAYDPKREAAPEEVVAKVASMGGGTAVTLLQVPSPVLPVFVLEGKDARGRPARWIADPVTGALREAPRTWIDTMHDLHYYLLLPPAWGMQANAVGAAVLLLLAATGMVVWWSGLRAWTRGLRVNLRANWRRVNYDLHSAIGFWTLSLVVWWAMSGVYFGFYKQVTAMVSAVSPLRGMRAPEVAAVPVVRAAGAVSLRKVIEAAEAVSPQGRLWSVSDPLLRSGESYVLLDRGAPGDFSHRDIVRVRAADARVLSVWHYGERHTLGDWVLWSMHPLHFGTVWGPVVKLVWCVLGLMLAVLTVTGLLMYWNRYLRRQLRVR